MILVTGGAGYIGSHCSLELLNKGIDIVIFDNLSTGHKKIVDNLQSILVEGQVIDFVKGDLRNFSDINQVFKKYNIDAVIHFAALSQVLESEKNCLKYEGNNIQGSINLLDAMVQNNSKNIVFASTACVYGYPNQVPILEEHKLQPINNYGRTKLIIEEKLREYDLKYGLKSIILRYFNVVGASRKVKIGEHHVPESHIVPNVLKAALGYSKTFELYGEDYDTKDGTCIRDYVDIEDLVYAHWLALEYLIKHRHSDIFNIGTSEGYSVKEVFYTCEKVTGEKIKIKKSPRRMGDADKLLASNEKIKKKLGWKPQRSLEESIEAAWEWEKILARSF